MNVKPSTWAMLAAMAVVWLLVAWRVFKNVSLDTGGENNALVAKEEAIQPLNVKETFQLSLDYPDPFLKHTKRKKITSSSSIATTKPAVKSKLDRKAKVPKVVSPVTLNNMIYKGIIQNLSNGRSTGLMSINNVEYIITERDSIKGVWIKKVGEDELILVQNENLVTLKLMENEGN